MSPKPPEPVAQKSNPIEKTTRSAPSRGAAKQCSAQRKPWVASGKFAPRGERKAATPTPQGRYRFLSHTSALRVPHSGLLNKLQSEPLFKEILSGQLRNMTFSIALSPYSILFYD